MVGKFELITGRGGGGVGGGGGGEGGSSRGVQSNGCKYRQSNEMNNLRINDYSYR